MERDGQAVVVEAPEFLEDQFRLGAGVDEDQRGAVGADALVHLLQRMNGHVPGPGQPLAGRQDFHLGGSAGPARDQAHVPAMRVPGPGQPGEKLRRFRHRGRQSDPPGLRRQPCQPGQPQRQKVAALGPGQSVQLVHDDAAQVPEERRRVGVGDHQRQTFRRGHQDVRRVRPLPPPLGFGGVAGARLGADGQPHLRDGVFQIALDVHRERLQRRDVERVQPVARALRQIDQRRQEPRQSLAAAGGRYQQSAVAGPSRLHNGKLVRVRRPSPRPEPAQDIGGEEGGGRGHKESRALCGHP